MIRGRTGRRRTGVAAALALVVAAAVAPPTVAAPRSTPTGAGVVPVRLSGLTPLAPSPGGTLVVTGSITNEGATEVSDPTVGLRISPTPVHARSEIPAILAGTAGRSGVSVSGSRTVLAATLAPGATASFRLVVPVDDLRLPPSRDEVALLSVESLGDVAGDGQGVIQTGVARVFLPWFPVPGEVTPTPVVWLFPLTSAPARASTNVFLDDHLATEVGASGRLTRLLDAASVAPRAVSWVVDPALLQSLEDMADGYQVRRPDGTLVAGTGSAAAAAWLIRLRALTSSAEVTASAYANPDVVAMHRSGLDVDIALAATTARDLPAELLATAVGHGLAWPAAEVADDGTLDVLRATGARVVVLSALTLPASPPVPYTPSGVVDLATGGSPLRAAVADPSLSALVAAPTGPGASPTDPVVRRQAAIAELAMTTLELPTTPRTLVVAPPTGWSSYAGGTRALIATLASSPWAVASSLGALESQPASEVPRARTDYPAAARAAELPPSYLSAVSRARTRLASLRSVAPDTAGSATGDLEEALTRTESASWRSDLVEGRRLLATTAASIDTEIARVRVLSRAPVTLPGDSGVLPVTVANDLSRPARVGVRISGTPSTRFVAADVAPITLAPGQKATLEVHARVVGTGPVTVAISLLTPDGDTFGVPVTTEVRSAAYARAAQWVVGGLFAILILLLGVNFVRRRRPGATSAAPDRAGTSPEVSGG
jgi:Family of unknown function (DUF6049)